MGLTNRPVNCARRLLPSACLGSLPTVWKPCGGAVTGTKRVKVTSSPGKTAAAPETPGKPAGTGLADDLAFLEQVRWFRMTLSDRICAQSATSDEKVLHLLRQEPAGQIAEFYYLLACQNIKDAAQIDRLAELHNAYVVDVTKNEKKMNRLGLTRDRLLDAMFTADTRPRLIQNWSEEPGSIDQSNLARFLAVVMSAETCRKILVACADAGFLVRTKTPYGTFLVRSQGTLERIMGETLREARLRGR